MSKDLKLQKRIEALNEIKCEVFLSYRSTHVDFAHRVFHELKYNNGIDTWFDKDILHENVGSYYKQLIHKGIENARVFLFLYSKDAEDSEFIINEEIGYANKLGKTILCFPIDLPDFTLMVPTLDLCIREREWINKDTDAAHCLGIQEEIEGELLRQQKSQLIGETSANTSIYVDKNLYLIRVQVQKALGYSTTIGNYFTISKCGVRGGSYSEGELALEILPLSFKIPIPSSKIERLEELKFFNPVQKDSDPEASTKLKMQNEIEALLRDIQPDSQLLEQTLKDFIHMNYNLADIYDWLIKYTKERIPKSLSKDTFGIDDFLKIVSDITADWFIREKADFDKGHFNGAMTGVYEVLEDPIPDIERHRTTLRLYYSDYFTFRCMERVYHILCSIKDCFQDINRTNLRAYSPFLCSLGLGGFVIANTPRSTSLVWVKRGKTIAASSLWHFSYDETSNIYKDSFKSKEGKIRVENKHVRLNPKQYLLRGLDEEIGLKPESFKEGQYGIFEVGLIKCDRLEMELLSYAIYDCPDTPPLPMQFKGLSRGATDAHNEIDRMDFVPLISSTYKFTGRFLTPEANYLSLYLNDCYSTFELNRTMGTISNDVQVGRNVKIGKNCLIEEYCHLGDNCIIGENCKIHRNVFIDHNVMVGNLVKIQNNNSIYEGVTLEDGVFVGTNVCFTNDLYPRAIRQSDGKPVTSNDWTMYKTTVKKGASIGAGAVIRCGVTIGEWAMVGCGTVVLEDVPAGATVVGNPARIVQSREPQV